MLYARSRDRAYQSIMYQLPDKNNQVKTQIYMAKKMRRMIFGGNGAKLSSLSNLKYF